jgi:hypothetical protein
MGKKLSAIILTVLILIGVCSCSIREKETDRIESNLKKINQAIEQFSELKNGTLEVNSSLKSENNAVESLNTGTTEGTSLLTFISNQKGYDFIEETSALNKKTGEIQYTSIKQVNGSLFYAQGVDSLSKERAYVWQDTEKTNETSYEPNGALRMMAVPAKVVGDREYIESVTREKNGSLIKYTVTTNNAYAKYLKEITHGVQENYIVHEHREIYLVNENGLLVKHQSYDESEWTIDGIADTYAMNVTAKLTGYNYKKLKEIGSELPPMIMFEGELYTQSSALIDVNLDALVEIGTIESVIGSIQEPEQNNQSNRPIKNAILYRSGENDIIVKFDDYTLYGKNQ